MLSNGTESSSKCPTSNTLQSYVCPQFLTCLKALVDRGEPLKRTRQPLPGLCAAACSTPCPKKKEASAGGAAQGMDGVVPCAEPWVTHMGKLVA